MSTRFQTLDHSGWWFICSATRATRLMNPHAWLKSAHWKRLEMAERPTTRVQPGRAARLWAISSSVARALGMSFSFRGFDLSDTTDGADDDDQGGGRQL